MPYLPVYRRLVADSRSDSLLCHGVIRLQKSLLPRDGCAEKLCHGASQRNASQDTDRFPCLHSYPTKRKNDTNAGISVSARKEEYLYRRRKHLSPYPDRNYAQNSLLSSPYGNISPHSTADCSESILVLPHRPPPAMRHHPKRIRNDVQDMPPDSSRR